VSCRTSGELLMIRDTVFFDTPARRAMSLMVAALPAGGREDPGGEGWGTDMKVLGRRFNGF
jgi:hypothetical protein